MRTLSVSFARGEISPDLHARVDLAFYNIALAKLKNMIVLPQGVLTRRPGFVTLGALPVGAAVPAGNVCPVRLIPFIYNSEDTMVIELGDRFARIWQPRTAQPVNIVDSPYAVEDLKDIKYIQNGNVLFLTHRDYPIKLLRRNSLSDWAFSDLDFKKGPWLDDSGGENIRMCVTPGTAYQVRASANYFTGDMAGRLLRLKHTISGEALDEFLSVPALAPPAPGVDMPTVWKNGSTIEIYGQWHLRTFGEWEGTIDLQKSLDNGENWITVYSRGRSYSTDSEGNRFLDQGNADISGSEAEENVIYRVRVTASMSYRLEALGYTKTNYFRITSVISPTAAVCSWQKERYEVSSPIENKWTNIWDLGAWGGSAGYPGCAAFYQERLVLAGSRNSPQTIWFSKTAQYDDFGETDPITDDAPITITIAGGGLDGIHSLLAMTDILAFTAAGEWKISGVGENGALSPLAVVAHKQSNVGSCSIQPVIVGSAAVMVQTMRTDVYSEQYSFDLDGYMGSNISILSRHLFAWKTDREHSPSDRRVRCMAYQQIPDSLLWLVLEDGTAVTCTLQAEHEMIAWARQETPGNIGDVCCVPGDRQHELWAAVRRRGDGKWYIERLAPRMEESVFIDARRYPYESLIETLRINMESQNGSLMAGKKFIPRLTVFALRSGTVHAAPKTDRDRARDRTLEFEYDGEMGEAELMFDNGFEKNAGVQIWTDDGEPLTILALSPTVAVGG
jgi:hypothetical protein